MKVCENCGKEHEVTYGSGRFCSCKCARGFSTKAKRKEINREISKKLKGRSNETLKLTKHKETKICPECKETFASRKKNQLYCSRNCARKNNGSCESAREKISKKAQERLKNGTFSGWKSRKDKEPSYPEKYFISLFENEKIEGWKRDYKVGRWFIDFAFIDKKLALEIDGKQHEERKEKDQIKDKFLEKNDWKVLRIKWYNPINDNNKEKLYKEIEELKIILNDKL
jgi:very-short-patch-repair endonuclease